MWDKPQVLLWFANLLTVAAIGLLGYAGLWFLANSTFFPVRTVKVVGQMQHVTQQQLDYVVQHEVKGTFFTFKVAAVRDAFEKLPWVKKVMVYRRWPDTIEVSLTEHKAVARWGENALLDTDGTVFDAATTQILPVLEGPEGTEKEMLNALHKFGEKLAPLQMQPTKIWLSPRRAWQIEVDGGLLIELGRESTDARLARFVKAYPEASARLHSSQVKYIDLRYSNGFAVRLPGYRPEASA
jgi:cell division protein FtsQ